MQPVSDKHVLIVSYWFPPAVGAAAERIVAFARYLSELDWRVSVLCARHGASPEIDGVNVIAIDDPLQKDAAAFTDYDPHSKEPAWKSFARRFVFPDRFTKWKSAAEARVREIQPQLDVSVVLASFPPASAATLGVSVASAFDAPLVLDFRDRWLGPGGYAPDNAKLHSRHEALQAQCIKSATGIMTVSENMAHAMIDEHDLARDRVVVIPNGYFPEADERRDDGHDEDKQPSINCQTTVSEVSTNNNESDRKPSTITIAHVGTVIQRNHPDRFFNLLQQLQQESPDALHGVHFNFVGNLSRDYVTSLALDKWVSTTGLVGRAQARAAMRDADALLLLVGDYVGKWGHNAKVFEYVQTGRPILCIEDSAESNDGELLRQFVSDRAFFADFESPERLTTALSNLKTTFTGTPNRGNRTRCGVSSV